MKKRFAFVFSHLLSKLDLALHLLQSLLQLACDRTFILELPLRSSDVLVLLVDRHLQLLLLSLQVGDLLLSDGQFRLGLPPLLVHLKTSLLLPLVRVLQFVKCYFKLGLDLVQIVHLVLGLSHFITGFRLRLLSMFLLLVQLVDQLVLVRNLIIETPYNVVFVSFLLLRLLHGHLDLLDVLPEGADVSLEGPLAVLHALPLGLRVRQLLLGCSQFLLLLGLQVGGCCKVALVAGQVALTLLNLSHHGLLGGVHLADLLIEPIPDLHNGIVGTASLSSLLLQLSDHPVHVDLSDEPLGAVEQEVPGPISEEQVLLDVPEMYKNVNKIIVFCLSMYLCMTGIISFLKHNFL